MVRKTVLIADAKADERESLCIELERANFRCECVDSARGALVKIRSLNIQVVIIHRDLPDTDGLELFRTILQFSPKASVVIVTDEATVDSSIEALRLGAIDYLVRPFNIQELVLKIKRIFAHKDFVEQAQYLHQQLNQPYKFSNIVAASPAMQRVCDLICRVSGTDSNVLITGNSGTGKELVARAIHLNSPRRDHPFVTINCGAMNEAVAESELFGHKKGAFTSAIKDKIGLFKVADKGTLFFDEVGCLTNSMQSKLLRAIEFNMITPVGGVKPMPLDIRIIASTNRRLKEEIQTNNFREDLYYRLSVFEIELPPLQSRREDIPPLVQHFVSRFAHEMKRTVKGVDADAMEILVNHDWKGEVRELENAIERAMIFCESDMITLRDLPGYLTESSDDAFNLDYDKPLKEALEDFERHFILENIRRKHGHRVKAFKGMKLSESSFYRKIEKLGLKDKLPGNSYRNSGR